MPLGDVAYEGKAFQACYGDDHSPVWPATFTVHLFEGWVTNEVTNDRVWTELPAGEGGYAPVTLANTTANFPAPVDGEQPVVQVQFTATGAFGATAYYAGLRDPGGVLVEYVELDDPLDVTEAGTVALDLAFWHNDSPEADLDEDF